MSMVYLVPHCKLLMRRLQIYFLRFFSPVRDDQEKLIPLSEEIKVLVLDWAAPSRLLEGKRFVQRPPDITVTTDASAVGWGAVCLTHRLSGRWSVQESRDHINLLELKAVVLALQGFEHLVVGRSVLIQSDNNTVVAYINRQGGTHSIPLCMMVLSLWEWCILKGMHLFEKLFTFQGRRMFKRTSFPGEVLCPTSGCCIRRCFKRFVARLGFSWRSTSLRRRGMSNCQSFVPEEGILKFR